MAKTVAEIREEQRLLWDKFAGGWKKWDSFTMDFLRPIGDEILSLADIREGDLVLDVATGTGEPGLTAAERVGRGRVIGTDLSMEMLKIAQDNAAARGLKNYEARKGDASTLAFKQDYFDSVVCRMGVMFFPDPHAAVSEMARVIKPGRPVVLCSWAGPEENGWVSTIGGIVQRVLQLEPPPKGQPGLFRFSTPGSLKELFSHADLECDVEKSVFGERAFESPQQYWDMMTQVAAPVATALAKADKSVCEEVKRKTFEATAAFSSNGALRFPWRAWVGRGVKPSSGR